MSDKPKVIQPVYLETQLMRALQELDKHEVTSEEYAKVIERISELRKLKEENSPSPQPVSRETLLVLGANLLGILMILNHEHTQPITSRAFGMLTRPKQV